VSAAEAIDDDFESRVLGKEARATRMAEAIIKRHFDMLAFPRPDQHNRLRRGWNRPIETRPHSMQAADFELRADLVQARQVLHNRVTMLMATQPISEYRLSVIYAIADLLGAEYVRDWQPLWAALGRAAWSTVMRELLSCNWNGLVGTSDRNKELFAELLMGLSNDTAPNEYR
jgi:hypothetical protein